MDRNPETMPAVLFGWAVFISFSMFLLPMSISKTLDKAIEIDAQSRSNSLGDDTKGSSVSRSDNYHSSSSKVLLNVSLVFYAMCIFYLAALFLSFVVYGSLNLIHAALDAFLIGSKSKTVARASGTFDAMNYYLNPANVLRFISTRYWSAHILVLSCILFGATVHSFVRTSRVRDEKEKATEYLFSDTAYTTVSTSFWLLYAGVIFRDMVCTSYTRQYQL